MINYKNGMADSGLYRSVLLDENEKIVSFAPPKSLTLGEFCEKHNCFNTNDYQINDIIEGTMVNLFHNGDFLGNIERELVGGNYWYFRTCYDENDKSK